jgi:tetratricopeptide (TPR) repeat protein
MIAGALFVLLCLPPVLRPAAVSAQPAALAEGRRLLEEASEGFFNESVPHPAVRGLLDRSRASFAALSDRCQSAYWQGRVEYLYGFVEQADRRSKAAQARFRQSLDLAGRALECGESSEAYRLMADAQAQLLISGGLAYRMTHGQKAKQWVLRAVELDPTNAAAQLSLALYYKNAPGFAGGNESQARRILHELEVRSDLERTERFSVNTWLGIAYAERKDPERARIHLIRAQAVYPGNTWLRELLAGL